MSLPWRKRIFLWLCPLLLALTAWQLRVESDLNAFFTATEDADSRLLANLLKSGELSRRYLLLVEAPANAEQTTLAAFSNQLVKRLADLADVEQVWLAKQPPRAWVDALTSYAPHHAGIFSLNPEADAAAIFDPAALPAKAAGLKQALLSPQAAFVKTVAKQDPLLLSLQGFQRIKQQFVSATADGALLLNSRAAALDADAQTRLQAGIVTTFSALNAENGSSFRLAMAGVPVFSSAAQREIGRDVGLVSAASGAGVIAVFLLLFRSFAALHWILLIQAAAFLCGALGIAVLFERVNSLTLALGASLIGICVDYPIHVMVHAAKHGETPHQAARLLWPALAMGGLTTVIGYAALGSSGFPGFEQIAAFALFSIVAALLLTRYVLPALLANVVLHPVELPGIAGWLGFCRRRRRHLLIGFGCAALVAIAWLPQVRWMDDMQNLALNMDELKQRDQAVRSHFSHIEPGRFVLVQADDLETALQRSEAAERRLQTLQGEARLSGYQGLFPWLVSQQLQHRNSETYNAAITPKFRETWHAALNAQGLAADKLALRAAGHDFLDSAALLTSPVQQILAGQSLQTEHGAGFALWLGDHDPAVVANALQGLPGVRYYSQKDQLDALAARYRDRSLWMLALGIVAMGLCVAWQQHSVRIGLLTLLPCLAATLFIFGAWAVLGEALSFLHVIGLLLAISLCVDYGIFFIDRNSRDSLITYHAIAASTLTTLASFAALGLGKTPTLPILALSVCLGVGLGFLLCPLLIPRRAEI
ncbi:MMPL family transporter [Methylomonas rhizoryzae]|uniref:MMPL family transporter n=1 Tax=Methylomonas rhizoryzae TaxID=2608981 RepID=UPI001232BCF4|nr:MMPL family transporter [Methylomonas rhizoryzae]